MRSDPINRRAFVVGVAGATIGGSRISLAQTSKLYRLGGLVPGPPLSATAGNGAVLIKSLEQRGYVLGQNLVFDSRGGESQAALVERMQELKASNVDAVVTVGYPPSVIAKASGAPTVIAFGSGDPVATHLVDGLARPGGNVTGISDNATTLSTKRLSLLKEVKPGLRRVAMIWNKDDLGMSLRYEASAMAANAIDVSVQPFGMREATDFNDAFKTMAENLPDAILVVADSLTFLNRKRIFDFAVTNRIPAIYEYAGAVREGGLMSYGPDVPESFERAANLIDRIFKGARPADLPFEQPTRYLFVLNLKTAKTMSFTVPNTALALADEVIE